MERLVARAAAITALDERAQVERIEGVADIVGPARYPLRAAAPPCAGEWQRMAAIERPLDNVNAAAPRGDRRGRFKSIFQFLLVGHAAALLLAASVSNGGRVAEGDTSSFDGYILRQAQLRRSGQPWLVSARTTALLAAASAVSSSALDSGFRSVFGRMQPGARGSTQRDVAA